MNNAAQMVRGWSGRMRAVAPVDQNPLVRYRPSAPEAPLPAKRWQRSRTMKITMQMRHRRKRWQARRPKGKNYAIGVLIALSLLMVILASSGGAYAYSYYQSQLPRLQSLANQHIDQTSRIYDRNGNLLYEAYNQQIGGGRRTPVNFEYIPRVMQDAMTSAEDKTFWNNPGIDPTAIIRAGGQYLQANAIQSGASTITQQLVKNLTGNTAVNLNRKLSEAVLAIGLTQQYSKAKILEMYFNVSPFGAQNLGVEAAVEDYFHLNSQCDSNFKCIPGINYLNCDVNHVSQCDPANCATSKYCDPLLGLARSSLLAGMPQDPPLYDPTFGFTDQATGQKYYLERQQYVLDQMLASHIYVEGLGVMTQAMVNKAEAMTAAMQFPPYAHAYYHGSQHFISYVISQLEQELGTQAFLTGGFNIRTTIDTNLESYVQQAINRHLNQSEYQMFPSGQWAILSQDNNVHDAAVVVMDAKSGELLAMDGSANYNDGENTVSGNIDMALAPRQPGSAFKPIIYSTAFEQGWYPGIVLPDVKTYFPAYGTGANPATQCPVNEYCPQDYGQLYHNWTGSQAAIRIDLADSINVPAVKTLMFAGVDNVANTARRFGITAIDDYIAAFNNNYKTHATQLSQTIGPAFALGTVPVSLLQMVGAYQVLANQGRRVSPQTVLDIWDNYGHHLYHYDPARPQSVQILSPQITYMMTSVLADEYARQYEFWPDHDLSFWNNGAPDANYPDVAAKTGTTQDFKDNLTIGYTSSVVVGVWAGNANDSAMNNVVGITGAAPIWHSVMTYVSGMCNQANDGIPCGKMDLNLPHPQFQPPQGVQQACVSSNDGLQGSGLCDWMLDGENPQQSGVSSGNNNNGNPHP